MIAGRYRSAAVAVLLFAVTLPLYAWRLGDTPMYMSPDEVIIAGGAHSIASTGRDVEGNLLPLYFNIQMPGEERKGWFTPMIFYVSALFLKVLPLSEWSARLPTAMLGAFNVALMYLVGQRLLQSERLALGAAAVLALSPAHFILSRLELDYVYPIPFILGWLWCVASYIQSPRPSLLFGAGMILGCGFYSYISGVLLMPLYVIVTCAVLWQMNQPWKMYGRLAAGFAVPLLLLIPWLIGHPTAVGDTLNRYDLAGGGSLNILQTARSLVSGPSLEQLASRYWNFFNPSFLFFAGGSSTMFSTRQVGMFVPVVAICLAAGVYSTIAVRRTPLRLAVLFGFLTAPIVALIVAEDAAAHRVTPMLPFGVLLAAFGVEHLASLAIVRQPKPILYPLALAMAAVGIGYDVWSVVTRGRLATSAFLVIGFSVIVLAAAAMSSRVRMGAMVVVVVGLAVPYQFAKFHDDYFGDYRLRSAPWFGGNLKGALEGLIELDAESQAPRIYFTTLRSTGGLVDITNRWMQAYWSFYLAKHDRQDLQVRTTRLDAASLDGVPSGSLLLSNVGEVTTDALIASGALQVVRLTPEVGRPEYFRILRR